MSAQESVAGLPTAIAPRDGTPASRRARSVLATTSAIHFVHDGFSDVIYLLLPVWATQFGLTYGQVGLLRTVYSGGMAAFQIPAVILAERWGETRLLAAGTAVTALGFLGLGVPPPTPEWGTMISEGQAYFQAAWWVSVFPGLAIFIVGFGLSLLADGLSEKLDAR